MGNVRLVNVIGFGKHVLLKLKMQIGTLTFGSCLLNRMQVQVYENFIWKRWMLHYSTTWMVLVRNNTCFKASVSFNSMSIFIISFWNKCYWCLLLLPAFKSFKWVWTKYQPQMATKVALNNSVGLFFPRLLFMEPLFDKYKSGGLLYHSSQ